MLSRVTSIVLAGAAFGALVLPAGEAPAASGSLVNPFAQSTVGTPIVGIPVGLEGDPGSVVAPVPTNEAGQAVFVVRPGRYSVMIWTIQTLNDDVVARVEVGRTVLTSAPIQLGQGPGRAYFMAPDGRRLFAEIPRSGGRVRVILTKAVPDDRTRRWTPVVPRPRDD